MNGFSILLRVLNRVKKVLWMQIHESLGENFKEHAGNNLLFYGLIINLAMNYFSAQLLCQNYHHRRTEENRDLLKERHQGGRRNHLRLQIPLGGRENSLLMWYASM